MIPTWLHVLSILSLAVGIASSAWVVVDVARRPRGMAVMNVVWPVVALFAGPVSIALDRHASHLKDPPRWVSIAKGCAHCGAGCTLGDLAAEWLAFAVPGVLVAFGWPGLFGDRTYAVWALDLAFAFVIGIAFQYFAIAPMRDLGPAEGLVAAIKADTLSLASWQIGMYAFMAFAKFWLFRRVLGTDLNVDRPEFWFMMQLAMGCGFATSFPVNAWLISTGIKEAM